MSLVQAPAGRRIKLLRSLASWPLIPWSDLLKMVIQDLERNPGKTVLTMLGLVIGSGAVVAVTSVGLAGRDYAIRQLETLGSNFIWVSYNGPSDAQSGRTRELNERDFQDIQEQATALAVVTRVVVQFTTIFQGGKTYPISLVGTDENYARVRNLSLDQGRGLTLADVRDRRKVCLLARSIADKVFGQQTALRRTLKIEDFDFEVVGVFRDVRTPGVQTEISHDAILIPISVARFFSNEAAIDTIYAQAHSRELIDAAVTQVRHVLARNHGRAELYSVNNLGYFVRVVGRVSVALRIVVILLGGVALVVGGVGILNIMLISVSERTREIGMRVALGARRREILRLFFLEALVISLTGGVVGILLGSLVPLLIHTVFNFPMPVSALSIVAALMVSVVVGLTFGIFPALKAAELDPVEALRYE